MSRKHYSRVLLAVVLGLTAATNAVQAKEPTLKSSVTGTPQIKSIEAISFGPQGLLLIGDGAAGQIIAVDTGDTTAQGSMKVSIDNIDEKLASRLGTTAKGIEILRMAVNPASKVAYFAIRKQDDQRYLILTVDAAGKISDYVLENVKYARITLPAGENSRVDKVTDIAWADDRVLVAAHAKDAFASKILSVPAPLENDGKATITSAQTYHVAHGRWETNAPMEAILPYEEDGNRYLVGAFTCTPLVKYPLNDVKQDGKVKGISVVELGQGNRPRDMFIYEKGGKSYVLVNTLRHFGKAFGSSKFWTARVDLELLKENTNVNEKALRRVDRANKPVVTDRIRMIDDYAGVVRMDKLDSDNALVLREDGKGGLSLSPLPLP